jgi:hypothetical protein
MEKISKNCLERCSVNTTSLGEAKVIRGRICQVWIKYTQHQEPKRQAAEQTVELTLRTPIGGTRSSQWRN